MTKALKIEVGNWVAFNVLADATWYEVIAIDGFNLTVREGEKYAAGTVDRTLVKRVRSHWSVA